MTRVSRLLCVAFVIALPHVGAAQDQTLADIRQELTVLHVEMQKLKRELSTTGGAGNAALAGSALERLDGLEAEVSRLTAKTEQMEFRVNQVVADGTNRIGDLEYRLVELEGGDTSKLGQTSTLGGGAAPVAVAAAPVTGTTLSNASELAVNEAADFERASGVLASGDFRSAAEQFAAFGQAYPGSPLEAEAQLKRGEALEGAGDLTEAARAYLASFSGAPEGPVAPDALFHLGNALGRLGQTNEACVTLGEVGVRFGTSSAAAEASEARRALGCQ
jgi:tol-pal system protein YbgF